MAHLIACPECNKKLQAPDTLLGKKVQCPECKNTFTVSLPDELEEKIGLTTNAPASAAPQKPATQKRSQVLDDEPVKKKKKRDRDDDDDRRDEDDDEYLPKRRRRAGRGLLPHRGGMILAFGLIGLVGGVTTFFLAIFGIVAWIMGNSDIREIRSGRMDPEGESMTNAGRICGIIGTVVGGLWVLFVIAYFCIIAVFVGVVINAKNNMPPPRPVIFAPPPQQPKMIIPPVPPQAPPPPKMVIPPPVPQGPPPAPPKLNFPQPPRK